MKTIESHARATALTIRKEALLNEAEKLSAKKKKLYSNIDIESPMTDEEKLLTRKIAELYSQVNQITKKLRG